MIQTLKNYTKEKVLTYLLSLATNSSDETLIKMTHLMEMVPKKDYYKERIRWIRVWFVTSTPASSFPVASCATCILTSGTNGSATWPSITC